MRIRIDEKTGPRFGILLCVLNIESWNKIYSNSAIVKFMGAFSQQTVSIWLLPFIYCHLSSELKDATCQDSENIAQFC